MVTLPLKTSAGIMLPSSASITCCHVFVELGMTKPKSNSHSSIHCSQRSRRVDTAAALARGHVPSSEEQDFTQPGSTAVVVASGLGWVGGRGALVRAKTPAAPV